MRNVVGDGRGGEVGSHAGDRFYFSGDQIETALPFGVESVVVFVQIAFERFYHSDDFFLAHFLTAAQSVFVRTVVEQGVGYEVFFANKHARALRTANGFATTEANQVVPHVGVVPEMGDWRSVGGSVDESWNLMIVSQLQPFLDFDLAFVVREI